MMKSIFSLLSMNIKNRRILNPIIRKYFLKKKIKHLILNKIDPNTSNSFKNKWKNNNNYKKKQMNFVK